MAISRLNLEHRISLEQLCDAIDREEAEEVSEHDATWFA